MKAVKCSDAWIYYANNILVTKCPLYFYSVN